MRYWVYKDAQIVGPVDREQLSTAVGLRADTLVCPDDGGVRENDWRLAEDCPELSGLYYSSVRAPSADMPLEEFGLLERLQFESAGVGEAEDWLGALFTGTPVTELGKESKLESDGRLAVALKESQERVRELIEQVARLTRRLEELEAAPPRVVAAPAPVPVAPPPIPVEPPKPVELPQSVLPPMPTFAPPAPVEPPPPVVEDVVVIDEPPKTELPPAPASIPAPAAVEPPVPAEPENPNLLKLGTPLKKGVQLGAAKTFKTVKKEAPAAVLPPAPAPAAALPPMPSLTPASSVPAASDVPTVAPPPPMTGWNTPAPATPIFAQPSPLEAPPIPTLTPPAPVPTPAASAPPAPLEPPPLPTPPVPSMDTPPATLVGRAAAPPPSSEATPPGPATKEVLARLAKPAPKPEASAVPGAKPRSQKTFFIVAILGIIAFGVMGFLFLRNPTDVQQAVDMEPDAPMPSEEAQPAPIPMAQVQAPPVQQPPQQAPVAPEQPVMQDQRGAAIELVKGYPLDGDRGTIGQWLAYSFMSAPGGQDKWDAGAVEETTYMVEYTVLPKGRDAITYVFEADLARGTVMGKNPASRELLAGNSRPAQPKRAVKKRAARPKRVERPRAEPKLLPQLPLPSDNELLPPSEDDGSFRSDAVEPGL